MSYPVSMLQLNSLDPIKKLINSSLVGQRIARTRMAVLYLPWIGLAWQVTLAQSNEDFFAALLAASGSFILLFDTFRPLRFFKYPLSTLVVLGFAVTLQLGPLFFTAIEGNPITYNLKVPLNTFGHGVLVSIVCIISHAIYRKSRELQKISKITQNFLLQIRIFQPLRFAEVIVMGTLGLLTFVLVESSEISTPILKFIDGFRFLTIIPAAFVLQILSNSYDDFANKSKDLKTSLVLFAIFTGLIIVFSISKNSRGTFVVPLGCLLIGIIFGWLYGKIKIRLSSFLAFTLVTVLVVPIATDLATAMVMVRGLRSDISPVELLSTTLDRLSDREAIQNYRTTMSANSLGDIWDENYVNNLFLSRFANAKFPDNSLVNSSQLSPSDKEIIGSFVWWRLLLILPAPILSLLNINQSAKVEDSGYSLGDKMYYLATGDKYGLGSFRTGHLYGTGMAGFGYAYLFIMAAGLLLVFPLVDAHALVSFQGFYTSPLISAVAITQFMPWFLFSNAETVTSLFEFSLRSFIQPILLFALVRWFMSRIRWS